ncbi:hypothetical protein [Austwickia sp. TVS 96-490-7B]|uniref:hypothetical protein n=1 Tax=Austwickia sp. TVS 96-490-7B TaxID=2830843 RepID=UPI001C57546C|nr:hypothetical protein [Austwickia sp. TVS 96-490-7B]
MKPVKKILISVPTVLAFTCTSGVLAANAATNDTENGGVFSSPRTKISESLAALPHDSDLLNLPLVKANPQLSLDLLKSLPDAAKNSNVHIDSSIDKSTVLFYPDGTLVPGQSADKMQRGKSMRGCGDWTSFYAPPFVIGPVAEQNCGVFGHKGYTRGYTWKANDGVFTQAVVQARGYECVDYVTVPLPGSDCGYKGYREVFKGLGVGANGSGSVFWGNVISKPAVRGQSLGTPFPYSGQFI